FKSLCKLSRCAANFTYFYTKQNTMKNQSLTFSKYVDRDFDDYYAMVKNDAVMRYITGKGLSEQQARGKFNAIIEINNREREIGYFKVYAGEQFIGDCKLVRYKHNR